MRVELLRDWYDKTQGMVLNMDQSHALTLIHQGVAKLVREGDPTPKQIDETSKDKMLRRRYAKAV